MAIARDCCPKCLKLFVGCPCFWSSWKLFRDKQLAIFRRVNLWVWIMGLVSLLVRIRCSCGTVGNLCTDVCKSQPNLVAYVKLSRNWRNSLAHRGIHLVAVLGNSRFIFNMGANVKWNGKFKVGYCTQAGFNSLFSTCLILRSLC